jgi:hypothetical protein
VCVAGPVRPCTGPIEAHTAPGGRSWPQRSSPAAAACAAAAAATHTFLKEYAAFSINISLPLPWLGLPKPRVCKETLQRCGALGRVCSRKSDLQFVDPVRAAIIQPFACWKTENRRAMGEEGIPQ